MGLRLSRRSGAGAAGRRAATASRFDLPRALLGRKDCDFSFSGLKTAAARLAQTCETDQDRADLAAAVQTAIARQLAERSDRAMKAYARDRVAAGACASWSPAASRPTGRSAPRWRPRPRSTASPSSPRRMAYCTDNAAMIALAGAERLRWGWSSDIDAAARPRWPLDERAALADPDPRAGPQGRQG